MRRAMQTKFALSQIAMIVMMSESQSSGINSAVAHADAIQISTKQVPAYQQLIVKFKPNTITCDADGVARFSASINIRLEYLRTMSGDVCVIKLFTDNEAGFSNAQNLLAQHPDVEWVQLDAIRKPF